MKDLRYLLFIIIVVIGTTMTSCSESVEEVTETSISYTLTISPDLLKFVTPQVSYVDEKGNIVTVTGVQNLDNLVLENSAEVSMDGSYASSWSKQVITGTGYKCWTIRMKFNHHNFHSYMGVKYLLNELPEEVTDEVYDFHHTINTAVNAVKITKKDSWGSQSVDANSYADNHITVSVDFHAGDDVKSYLENLVKTPDKVGYFVDSDGNISRKDNFDL